MVDRRGLFGRVWGRLRDQQRIGIVILLVTNALLALFLLVPEAGPIIVGCIYVIELTFFIIVGCTLILTEEGW